METAVKFSTYPRLTNRPSPDNVKSSVSVSGLTSCFHKSHVLSVQLHHQCCSIYRAKPSVGKNFKKMALCIRSSVGTSPFDPSPNSSNGRTRLIRAIQAVQTKLDARINELRKNLPLKIFFFLVGFYSATAFSTVIGQTGDWDVLSAALAVVVVEGIGALMYKVSLPLLNKPFFVRDAYLAPFEPRWNAYSIADVETLPTRGVLALHYSISSSCATLSISASVCVSMAHPPLKLTNLYTSKPAPLPTALFITIICVLGYFTLHYSIS